MKNAPFGDFQRGDIVGIWSEGEKKLISRFLVTEKRENKLFGLRDLSSTSAAINFRGEVIELRHPHKYIKECSVKLD